VFWSKREGGVVHGGGDKSGFPRVSTRSLIFPYIAMALEGAHAAHIFGTKLGFVETGSRRDRLVLWRGDPW
jgi:hypothetical protein